MNLNHCLEASFFLRTLFVSIQIHYLILNWRCESLSLYEHLIMNRKIGFKNMSLSHTIHPSYTWLHFYWKLLKRTYFGTLIDSSHTLYRLYAELSFANRVILSIVRKNTKRLDDLIPFVAPYYYFFCRCHENVYCYYHVRYIFRWYD